MYCVKRFSWLVVASLCLSSHAAVLRVAPSGGDFVLIQNAVNAANPGDSVMVSRALYNETVKLSKINSADKPIKILAAEGDSVIVTGGFSFSGDFYTVSGFLITTGLVQLANGAEHNIIRNCRLENVSGSAIKFSSGSRNNTVSGCYVFKPGNKGVEMGGSYNTFEYSTVEGPAGQAGNLDSDGIRNYGGDHNVIRGNRIFHIYNVGESHGDAFQLWQYFHHLTFEDNIVGSRDDPTQDDPGNAHMMIELMDSTSDTLIIRRNLFLGADQAIDVYQNQDTRTARFKNVFVYNNLFATDQVTEFKAMEGLKINNNIFLANITVPYTISSGCSQIEVDNNCIYPGGASISEPHGIKKDPMFVNRESNFHLAAGSPCIDAGIDVGLSVDREGNPIKGRPDIGPFEFNTITKTGFSGSTRGVVYSLREESIKKVFSLNGRVLNKNQIVNGLILVPYNRKYAIRFSKYR